jgi:hypothetical protein
MTLISTLPRQIAIALAAASVVVLTMTAASAARNERGLINRPVGNPFVCRTDEGYGRYTSCDQGGA